MNKRPLHVGIDLGTTNSAAAVFDGESVALVRTRAGGHLTPSVVRYDARGNVTVGERARRSLDADPANTRSEFKRMMGSDLTVVFPAAGLTKRPEELAAEVLRAIRLDVADQIGAAPSRAVISVPALFELPQTSATAEAARLAGFDAVEMIQEPVASAIAAGWSADDPGRNWLVYDLGGGTFDASLLDTREGLLRVVGHDGDNFLGGRDIDGAIVAHVLAELDARGTPIDRRDPAHALGLRRLRHAAEEAKIELARANEAAIHVPSAFLRGGAPIDVDTFLDREAFEALVLPLVDRSIAVCLRLLTTHGMSAKDLDRLVLVGGPTAMPLLRRRVAEVLGAPFAEGLDPMTLVAQGAALYAATVGVDARPTAPAAPRGPGPGVWLQHPAVSSDPGPFVVGRVLERGDLRGVRVTRSDGKWASAEEPLDREGAFALPVELVPRATSEFTIDGVGPRGDAVALQPSTFRIVHGITVSDPPLSRTIGVALADDRVHVYFERGSPLPMRRTFTHRTVEAVSPQADKHVLRVPIVQGEFGLAHLCRLVGSVQVPSGALSATLPAGTEIEVTLELDRGGRLTARAIVPGVGRPFEQVAHLVTPRIPLETMAASLADLRQRANHLRRDALRRGDPGPVLALADVDGRLDEVGREIDGATGGDGDAAEKARRSLIDLDASLAEQEAATAWPSTIERAREETESLSGWVARYGSDTERRTWADATNRLEQLLTARKATDVERQIGVLRRLGVACYYRSPGAWQEQFQHAAARVSEAADLAAANAAVRDGRAALARDDNAGVEAALRKLWQLLPPEAEERRLGHDSGVR